MLGNKVNRDRNAHGQALTEGTALFSLVTLTTIAGMGLIIMIAQAIYIQTRTQLAAQVGVQEAVKQVLWSATRDPSYPPAAQDKILSAVNAELTRTGLNKLPDASYLGINSPVATGVPGRYVFTLKVNYPFIPAAGWKTFAAQGSAAAANANEPHGIAWIYADNCGGADLGFSSTATQVGGVMVPTYGGGDDPTDGLQSGSFYQHRLIVKGSYVLPEVGTYP